MIQSLRFKNYRVLRDAVLPLGPFTLLVGPNGSGKSTVLHALRSVRERASKFENVTSIENPEGTTSVVVDFADASIPPETSTWRRGSGQTLRRRVADDRGWRFL